MVVLPLPAIFKNLAGTSMRLVADCLVQLGPIEVMEHDAWLQNNRVDPHLQLRCQLPQDGRLLRLSRSEMEYPLDRNDPTQPR